MQTPAQRVPVLLNEPSHGWRLPSLTELWSYRALLLSLTVRELKVRYKQTAIGAAWVLLQPLLTMAVFAVFFSRLVSNPIEGIPYPVFIYAALVPWIYFTNSLSRMSGGLVEQQGIITKVYFPRLLIPLASLLAGLVDLAIISVVLGVMLIIFGVTPSASVWMAPLFLLLAMATAFSAGIWLAALNVEYRDVQQIIPFLLQTWFFATPIFYSAILVRPSLRFVYGLNPMAGVVEGFRWAVLGHNPPPSAEIFLSLAGVLVVMAAGLLYFCHVEDSIADVV